MRPDGSIQGIDAMQQLIAQAQTEPLWLYSASRSHCRNEPEEMLLTSQSAIRHFDGEQKEDSPRFLYVRSGRSSGFYFDISLLDMNVIENNYNDWFLFTDGAKAQGYLSDSCPKAP